MAKFVKKMLAVFVFIAIGLSPISVECETWGNIYTTSLIDTTHISRYGIPFMVREEEIRFPSKNMENGSDQERFVLHRIEHINHLDKFKCSPKIRIISGGIHFPNATMEIRSMRGCGIDSTIEFYGLEQKKPYENFDFKV